MGKKKEEQKQQQAQQQQAAQAQQAQQAPAAAAAPAKDTSVELKKLAELHNSGVLTDQEFADSKKKLLGI
jgi:formiminotetrahydrofolate cyclodeaminase